MNYKQLASVILSSLSIGYSAYMQMSPQPYELANGAIIVTPARLNVDNLQIAEDAVEQFKVPKRSWAISSALKMNFSQGTSVVMSLKKTNDLASYQLVCQCNGTDVDCSSLRFFCEDSKGQRVDCEYQPLESWRLVP